MPYKFNGKGVGILCNREAKGAGRPPGPPELASLAATATFFAGFASFKRATASDAAAFSLFVVFFVALGSRLFFLPTAFSSRFSRAAAAQSLAVLVISGCVAGLATAPHAAPPT
jgi:hypothetical protein